MSEKGPLMQLIWRISVKLGPEHIRGAGRHATAFADFIARDIEKWRSLVEAAGLKE